MKPIRPLNSSSLVGTWHVVATTLPFWKGRQDPTIRYDPLPDGRWRDTVEYRTARDRIKRIVGIDTLDPTSPGSFSWRGAGWLAWCTSRWCFVDASADEGWAITWFSPATLRVTPEGCDVYARRSDLDRAAIREIIARTGRAIGSPLGAGWFLTHRRGEAGGGEAP